MKIVSVEPTVVSVPYRRREISSQVSRDGVTDVLIRVKADDGQVGWGEACSGADAASVEAAVRAMTPFVLGRDPWCGEALRADVYRHGLWQFRQGTGNFAWAGIDMALWDLCGKAAGQPLYHLFGGLRRREATYFYYLAHGSTQEIEAQCADGLLAGFEVFYLKVGIDLALDLALVAAARRALGPEPRLRLDANGAWTLPQARHAFELLAPFGIDFIEQPVREHPVAQMAELRGYAGIAIAANEGLWSEADAYARIRARAADVFCFSPYWVGSLAAFQRLAHVAHLEGLEVCKHTHGELGVAAAACHQLVLTLPGELEGHQATAHVMAHDILRETIPIANGPRWGVPEGTGLCIEIDEEAVAEASARYRSDGQFLPCDPSLLTP